MPKGVYEREPLADRFFRCIERTEGCWNWIGSISGDGYGTIAKNGRMFGAHRLSYELVNGAIPEGLLIRHTCDNTLCVNPAHLITGTHQDNMKDRGERQRQARGEGNAEAKLTEAQVREIRAIGYSQRLIDTARRFGISKTQTSRILRKETWKHIPE